MAAEKKVERRDEQTVYAQMARTMVGLFDSLYEGLVAVNRDCRVVWMNNKYKALIGWNGLEDIEGQVIEDVIPNSRLRQVVETGRAELIDIMQLFQLEVVVSRIPLTDENGQVVGAVGLIVYDRVNALKPLMSKYQHLQKELDIAQRKLARKRSAKYTFDDIVGDSAAMRALREQAVVAAGSDATVLLTGETGTGKEMLAHAIHAASPRADKPMVRVNAAAIPETLLEAELFGTAPGAYTGADRRGRDGKFKVADGGTLFLDEVGDMPLGIQAKLLRVLQEQEIEPLGANAVINVDVRIITATSQDLTNLVETGRFRADLFYRLNVLPLRLPALRERREDIGMLCSVLLSQMAERSGGALRELFPDAVARLQAHEWPGNVRELRNVLERSTAFDANPILGPEAIDDVLDGRRDQPGAVASGEGRRIRSLRNVVAEAERQAIRAALEVTGNNRTQAARLLSISRAQFYEKLTTHGFLPGKPDTKQAV